MSKRPLGIAGRAGALGKVVLLGGAALALVTATNAPAFAQTEREKRLEKRVNKLENELRSIKGDLRNGNTKVEKTATGDAIPPNVVRSGEKNVTLSLTGQVNRAVMSAFNDDAHNLFFVDNDNSSTRFRFTGRANIDKYWSAFAQIEVELESNASSGVNQLMKTTAFAFNERKLEVHIRHKTWGTVWVGQGDTASNTVAEKDLSGTAVVGFSDIDTMGGPRFGTSAGNSAIASAPQIKDVFDQLDGNSRKDRLRLDSPKLYGFMLSTSVDDDYARDVALHYSGEPLATLGITGKNVLKVAAGLGYFKTGTPGDVVLSGSVSALHVPTGLNVTFAAGGVTEENTTGRNERTFWYVKGGWQFGLFGLGKTAVSVEYGVHEHVRINNEEAHTIGVQFVQKVDAAAMELYVGFRHHELDTPGTTSFGNVQIVITGARIKF